MSERETIRRALIDAIGWQNGLADAYSHMRSDPAYAEARAQEKQYRALLKKRYGTNRTPIESLTDGAKTITIQELSARREKP